MATDQRVIIMRKLYLIQRYDESLKEWRVEPDFVFDTLEEAEQSMSATYEYHNIPGYYRIIEIEKYREVANLTVIDSDNE